MYVKNQHKANQYNLKNLMLIFLYTMKGITQISNQQEN